MILLGGLIVWTAVCEQLLVGIQSSLTDRDSFQCAPDLGADSVGDDILEEKGLSVDLQDSLDGAGLVHMVSESLIDGAQDVLEPILGLEGENARELDTGEPLPLAEPWL